MSTQMPKNYKFLKFEPKLILPSHGHQSGSVGGSVYSMTLNRPKALNSLNLTLVNEIKSALSSIMYPSDPMAKTSDTSVVLLKGEGRAFCAGGDVKKLCDIENISESDPPPYTFFREEYHLDHLLATSHWSIMNYYESLAQIQSNSIKSSGLLKKLNISKSKIPKSESKHRNTVLTIPILDGIVMGGGVGISVHSPIRVATENTLFSMPECSIGLYPDVGGSFFLSSARVFDSEAVGLWLALTGARLKGKDNFWSGFATHYIPSESLPELEKRILDVIQSNSSLNTGVLQDSNKLINVLSEIMDEYASSDVTSPLSSEGGYSLADPKLRNMIEECFGDSSSPSGIPSSVEKIFENLSKHENAELAEATLKTLKGKSPTSLKLTLRQLQYGSQLDFASCLKMEYRMSRRVLEAGLLYKAGDKRKSPDFYEGVRAVLVDRDNNPQWFPRDISDVKDEDIDWYFRPFDKKAEKDGELDIGTRDIPAFTFDYYPKNMGLPSQRQIEKLHLNLKKRKKDLQDEDYANSFIYGSNGAPKIGRKVGMLEKIKLNKL
jgi:enoyl-CoA hydratase/carnithine racemase